MNQKPDFENSIVNLAATLGARFGADPAPYRPLPPAATGGPLDSAHLLLIIVDGLGGRFLARHPHSTLQRHRTTTLTSVFPTTTASAITSYFTGVAPQQHAITGWYTWLRELGSVAVVLPFVSRVGNMDYTAAGLSPADLIGAPSLFNRTRGRSIVSNPRAIAHSVYSTQITGGAEKRPHRSLNDFFHGLAETIKSAREPTLAYGYWTELDALAHRFGIGSPRVERHFADLDQAFARLLHTLAGQDVTVLVSADHGLIDTAPAQVISIDRHPELAHTLTLPLCGEPRAGYAYVHAGRREMFEAYVREELGHCCDLYQSDALVREGLFGLGEPHPELAHRIGDYVILPKQNHVITQRLPGEGSFAPIGVHGGLSADELEVPLIALRP